MIRLIPGYVAYCLGNLLGSPLYFFKALKNRSERGAEWARSWGGTRLQRGALLIVANGLGEARVGVQAAQQIRDDLGWDVVVLTQKASAVRAFPECGWLPYQTPWSAVLCLIQMRPRAVLCVETATNNHLCFWARILVRGHKGARVAVAAFSANFAPAQLHKMAATGMKRWRLELFQAISAQSDEFAEGIRSVYHGQVRTDFPPCMEPRVRTPKGRPIIIAGSTYREDEELVRAAFSLLPAGAARMIIAPRKSARGEGVNWSDLLNPLDQDWDVLTLDVQGVLADLYARARLAYVGGTLDPGLGGHTPLEALRYGLPLTCGPEHGRQPYIKRAIDAGICQVVTTPESLAEAWQSQMNQQPDTRAVTEWYEQGKHAYSELARELLT